MRSLGIQWEPMGVCWHKSQLGRENLLSCLSPHCPHTVWRTSLPGRVKPVSSKPESLAAGPPREAGAQAQIPGSEPGLGKSRVWGSLILARDIWKH